MSIIINVMMSGPSPNPEGSLFFRAVFPEKRSFHPKWGNQQHYITLTHSIRINGEVLELLYQALSEMVPLNMFVPFVHTLCPKLLISAVHGPWAE